MHKLHLAVHYVSHLSVTNSPLQIKSQKSDNIGIRQHLKTIAKTLVENYRKWDAAHRRGITLCKAIEKCKSHAIQIFNSPDSTERTLYPDELKPFCDKLKVITTIFEDILDSANESKRQIDSFIKMGATNVFAESQLVFRTWKCDTLRSAVNKICESYANEYKIKIKIMQNIAHSRSEDELTMHLAVWEYQMHVNTDLEISIRALAIEADIDENCVINK